MDLVSTYHYVTDQDGKTKWSSGITTACLNEPCPRLGAATDIPGWTGIKTGSTTEAGYCLAATAERSDLRLIAVVLGAESSAKREEDIRTLPRLRFSSLPSGKWSQGKGKSGPSQGQAGESGTGVHRRRPIPQGSLASGCWR